MNLKALAALLCLLVLLVISIPGFSVDDEVAYAAIGGIVLVGVISHIVAKITKGRTKGNGEN